MAVRVDNPVTSTKAPPVTTSNVEISNTIIKAAPRSLLALFVFAVPGFISDSSASKWTCWRCVKRRHWSIGQGAPDGNPGHPGSLSQPTAHRQQSRHTSPLRARLRPGIDQKYRRAQLWFPRCKSLAARNNECEGCRGGLPELSKRAHRQHRRRIAPTNLSGWWDR